MPKLFLRTHARTPARTRNVCGRTDSMRDLALNIFENCSSARAIDLPSAGKFFYF
jgi:hypothetical protein